MDSIEDEELQAGFLRLELTRPSRTNNRPVKRQKLEEPTLSAGADRYLTLRSDIYKFLDTPVEDHIQPIQANAVYVSGVNI